MTPCGMNNVTPTMIRNGQMNIGDKIVFEDDIPVGAEIPVSSVPTVDSADIASASAANGSAPTAGSIGTASVAAVNASEHTTGSADGRYENNSLHQSDMRGTGISGMAAAAVPEDETAPVSSSGLEPALEAASAATAAASTQLTETITDTAELQPLTYGMGNVSKNPSGTSASAHSDESMWHTPAVSQVHITNNLQTQPSVQAPPPSWPNRPEPVQYEGENRNLITYPRMTDYFQDSVSINDTSSTPTFTVPSNPMTPPEYTQTLDYDSIQYMNGFLRTQIGRFVRIEQLVGSNTIEDREGFLVGASNNYVLLQEIGTGNIMTFDLFSIKFVYIYYEDIPKPQPRP